MTGWEGKKVGGRLRVHIFGEPPAARSPEPSGYELAIYDGDDRDASIAVVQATHFAELARFVDAVAKMDEPPGNAIRRAGTRLDKVRTFGFDAQGYFFELGRIG